MFFSYMCKYWGHERFACIYNFFFFYMHVNLAGMMNYFFDLFLLYWDFIFTFYRCIWYSRANMNWCIFVIMCHIQIYCHSQYLMKCFPCFSIVISLTFSHDILSSLGYCTTVMLSVNFISHMYLWCVSFWCMYVGYVHLIDSSIVF